MCNAGFVAGGEVTPSYVPSLQGSHHRYPCRYIGRESNGHESNGSNSYKAHCRPIAAWRLAPTNPPSKTWSQSCNGAAYGSYPTYRSAFSNSPWHFCSSRRLNAVIFMPWLTAALSESNGPAGSQLRPSRAAPPLSPDGSHRTDHVPDSFSCP